MTAHSSPLRGLADAISEAVTLIDDAFASANQPFPSLTALFTPTSPSEAIFARPDVAKAVRTIALSSSALCASVEPPAFKLAQICTGYTATAAFEVAVKGCVAEILGSDPNGLHVDEIAAQNGLHAGKLGRLLRRLASNHVFSEVAPNVFANNRLSSTLDTLKPLEEIRRNPVGRFAGTTGMAALVHHTCDVTFKGDALLYEVFSTDEYASTDAPEKAAVPYAFETASPMYEWFELPGNEERLAAFSAGMSSREMSHVPDAILQGEKAVSTFLRFQQARRSSMSAPGPVTTAWPAKHYPNLQYVVEDRPAVVEKAKELWQDRLPEISVKLIGQNSFHPQAIKGPGVFLLNNILHNHGRAGAFTVLKHLRDAAGPNTKLIIGEQIAPYACHEPPPATNDIKGADKLVPQMPSILAPGRAEWPSIADVMMLCNFNSEERTLGGFVELAAATGWKIVQVTPIAGILDSYLVAEPV